MVKKKHGFNWKARQQSETIVDKSAQSKIQVDLLDQETEKGFDDSNLLALPSKKRDTKTKNVQQPKVKRLTKKERRKLEKVVEIKDKKAKRSEILESLAAHQASQDEMRQFISISEVMSGRIKRKYDDVTNTDVTVNTIAGSNKKRRRKKQAAEEEVESSDSEESIHTSDMSSDEEYSGEFTWESGEVKTDPDLISGDVRSTKTDPESDVTCENEICSDKINEDINNAANKTQESANSRLSDTPSSDETLTKTPKGKTKLHARGTSGNWVVSEIESFRQNINQSSSKTKEKTTSVSSDSNQKKELADNKNRTINSASQNKAKVSSNGGESLEDKSEDTDKKIEESEVKVTTKKAVNIPVDRDEKLQAGRLKLPILGEEQVIMEAINENPVNIICGETGSGKTTQVPQFLYEAGYAHGEGVIGVTEPRRVAAVSMSSRVATEMSLTSNEVSYQIRYEGNVTPNTKIKFMTDGVLLKEVQKDFLLTKYSVVIIDEAHERSVYTDILIGLLSRIVPLRQKRGKPLKLVIMSATLRVEDFTENKKLFKVTPPVIKVDSRQFPVTINYNKRTPLDDYLTETFRKACKMHRMLPEGGILVFVTGQQEVHTLCKKLKKSFPMHQNTAQSAGQRQSHRKQKVEKQEEEKNKLPKISLDNYSVSPLDDEDQAESSTFDLEVDDYLGNDDLDNEGDPDLGKQAEGESSRPMYVLPLYSLLSTDRQKRVFGPVPEGCRLCVIATNVAETSLTIPGIKYVVDTGKMKTKLYDRVTGVSTFQVTWTSKASADQRAGRAGRVAPGHCYRLYSSAVFNDEFEKFSPAEITRRPVDDLVLQMKDMNIEKVVNFPYPTPPDREQIQAAEHLLVSLGALTAPQAPRSYKDTQKESVTTITPLGRAMASFPVNPRYSKMLAMGQQHNLLPYVVVIVSALSVQELFEEVYSNPQQEDKADEFKQRLIHLTEVKRRWAATGHSLLLGDLMVMLKAVGSSEFEGCTPAFCEKYGIRMKAMREVRKLRVQLTNSVNLAMPEANICVDPQMAPPDNVQAKLLRQIVLSGMGDHVARKLPDMPPSTSADAKKLKHAYQCPDLEEPVFIHPTSILYKTRPQWLVYQHIEETSKLYMKGITAIEPEWLPLFSSSHVTLSKPMESPAPRYDDDKGQVLCSMSGTFGHRAWSVPTVELEYPMGVEKMKWFAKFLLQGDVVSALKKYTPSLLSQPSTMVKSWAKLQPRTESLLKCLISERVHSKDSLLNVWKKEPTYLLSAMKEWIPEARHVELTTDWPKISRT